MQEITNSSTKSTGPVPMEIDLDDFDFRPVTKGLGFHHEKSISSPAKAKAKRAVRPRVNRAELGNSASRSSILKELPKKIIKKEKSARLGVQLTGFAFDMALIFCLQFSLNFIFVKVAKLDSIAHLLEFTVIEQSVFLIFIYLFYFTIFDITGSPGKRIFSMSLKNTLNKKLTMSQTLIRAVVTLVSLLLLGMPSLFDFQGKLSDTKLVEDV